MNEMEIGALQVALTRIKEMVFEDPYQPIKNVSHLLDAVEHILVEDGTLVERNSAGVLICKVCGTGLGVE